jgi:hypothetical protein
MLWSDRVISFRIIVSNILLHLTTALFLKQSGCILYKENPQSQLLQTSWYGLSLLAWWKAESKLDIFVD